MVVDHIGDAIKNITFSQDAGYSMDTVGSLRDKCNNLMFDAKLESNSSFRRLVFIHGGLVNLVYR